MFDTSRITLPDTHLHAGRQAIVDGKTLRGWQAKVKAETGLSLTYQDLFDELVRAIESYKQSLSAGVSNESLN